MIDLGEILKELACERPIFHSEADFQHALAWKIHQKFPAASIRLEIKPPLAEKKVYIDIWVRYRNSVFAIELKYKTKGTRANFKNESFDLLNQGAQDVGRYDFLKDIGRLEKVMSQNKNIIGYSIFLTNDSSYWKQPKVNLSTIDAAFRIHHGKTVFGRVSWGTNASKGTMKNRENAIFLKGIYKLTWHGYSKIDGVSYGNFKYLLVKIK